jgi:hypothetical protein
MLSHKVQNIEDAILGSDYFGEGIKKQTAKNSTEILDIQNKFKYVYYTIIGVGITGGWQLSEIIKKIFPAIF